MKKVEAELQVIKVVIEGIKQWLLNHRWLFGLKPKGWTDEDEFEYFVWCYYHGDARSKSRGVSDFYIKYLERKKAEAE